MIILVASNTLHSQEILNLDDCREQALLNNKELKKSELQQLEAIENVKMAKTAYLPSIKAEANLMHLMQMEDISMPGGFLPTADNAIDAANGQFTGVSNVYSPGLSIALDNLSIIYGGLSLTQAIYTGGKIKGSNQLAKSALDITELSYQLKYSEVINMTDKAFWTIAMVESSIEVAEEYIKMLTELEDQMKSMYDVGLSPASEKLKVTVKKNEAELQLLKAKNGLKLSKMYLKQILGLPLEKPIEIFYENMESHILDLNNGLESAINNRNELKIMSKQVEIAEINKKLALSDYLPQLGLSAQYTGSYISDFKEDLSFSPAIAAQLSIPLFQWGQGKYKQKASQLRIRQAETELSHTSDLVNLEVIQVKLKIEEALEAIHISEKNILEAEESLEETKASFEVGLNTTTDLLNSQADWQKAKSQNIQAISEYKILETEWLKVTGALNRD